MSAIGGPTEYRARLPVRVEFYTRSYHVSGDVELNRWRLGDLLNDRVNQFVLIQNAVREPLPELARAGGTELARAAQFLQIAREWIIFAIPHDSEEFASARHSYLSGLHSERQPGSATAIAHPFEIHATVHLRRVAQPRQALDDLPAEFLPVTNLDATYLLDPRLRIGAEFAVLNRPLLEIISIAVDSSGRVARDLDRARGSAPTPDADRTRGSAPAPDADRTRGSAPV